MMRLSTMLRVDGATSAEGRNPAAEAALERWRHDAGSVRFFRSSANFVHVFRVEFLAHRGESAHIREEHRHFATLRRRRVRFRFRNDGRRFELRSALAAELKSGWDFAAACGALHARI